MKFLITLILITIFAASANAISQNDLDQWLTESPAKAFHWTTHLSKPELSDHQRLAVRVEIQVDGRDLAARAGQGELLLFIRFTDSTGRTYLDHGTYDLTKVEEGIRAQDLEFTHAAFVLPGDYQVSMALSDTATGEHAARATRLHVAQPRNDPLPDAWRNLPPVEFIPAGDPPASWFLPGIQGELNLPLAPAQPLQIEVLVNLTPSERASGSRRVQSRNMEAIIPALKAIAQIRGPGVTLNISLLDLSIRKVAFRQENVTDRIDWPKLQASLAAASPGIIDVRALANRKYSAQFFVTQARKMLSGNARPKRILIILTSPVVFESGEDLHAIRREEKPGEDVYYLRIHPDRLPLFTSTRSRVARRAPQPGMARVRASAQIDQLAPLLKPLAPRLFDIDSPGQFRKALAAILGELSGN